MLSGKRDFSETWFSSCLYDLLELTQVIAKLEIGHSHLAGLSKCFQSIEMCLTYPFDKQQRIKTLYLKTILLLLPGLNRTDGNVELLDLNFVSQLLTCTNPLQKFQPLLLLLYEVVEEMIKCSNSVNIMLKTFIESGSQLWFLDVVVKDINQKRHIEYVAFILCSLCESEAILKQVANRCSQLPSLITVVKDNSSRVALFRLCIQVVGLYQSGLDRYYSFLKLNMTDL